MIDYLDFADSYQMLLGNKTILDPKVLGSLTSIAPSLERLTAVRNRVAHSRPMEIDDLAVTYEPSPIGLSGVGSAVAA